MIQLSLMREAKPTEFPNLAKLVKITPNRLDFILYTLTIGSANTIGNEFWFEVSAIKE